MRKKNILIVFFITFFIINGCDKDNSVKTSSNDKISKKLNIYNWSGIIASDTIANFEKKYNVKITYDNYSSNEELFAKLQAGAIGYDIIFPSDYMVDIMIKNNLIQKINKNKITNLKNISNKFKKLYFDSKNEYSIPYQYTTAALGINTNKVKNFKESWDLLFDSRYKGRISMLDDMRYGIAPALIKLGYSVNTLNIQELQKAKELMFKQKTLVKAYSSDTYIDFLKSGDVWISYGYSPDIFQIAKEKKEIVYIIPKEGTTVAIESMCIPKNAPNKETAELFINYILEPQVHADITNFTWAGNPNGAAYSFIDKNIFNNKSIFLSDSLFQKSEFVKDVGKFSSEYDRVWSEIKSN